MKQIALIPFVGMLLFVSAGCNFTEKYCEDAVACMSDVSDETVEECVADSDEAAADADTAGCGGEYDALSSCAYKNSTCIDEEVDGGSIHGYMWPDDECDSDLSAYIDCMSAE